MTATVHRIEPAVITRARAIITALHEHRITDMRELVETLDARAGHELVSVLACITVHLLDHQAIDEPTWRQALDDVTVHVAEHVTSSTAPASSPLQPADGPRTTEGVGEDPRDPRGSCQAHRACFPPHGPLATLLGGSR